MAVKKTSHSSWKLLFFTLALVAFSFIYYDIKQEGSWQASNTRKALNNSGISEYTLKAYDQVKLSLQWVDARIEDNFPGYQQDLKHFSEPYVELFQKLGQISCNIFSNVKEIVVEKYPAVAQSIEEYAPGLIEHSQKAVSSAWSSSVQFFDRSVDYLKKEVFVGQLSPENMQRIVVEALNTTQVKATEYYHWLCEKVQTTIK